MTLKQLEAFYWSATLGNFTAAATRLHLTPSTLSKRISELEAYLGSRLFERLPSRSVLTAAGERLIEHARQMLLIESRIKADLTSQSQLRGRCRIGISELVALTWFPRFVKRVQALHPGLILEPHVDLTEQCERRLEKSDLDFAVIPGPSVASQLISLEIATLDYAWMAAPDVLAADTLLTAKHFTEHSLIMLAPEARLTREINRWMVEQQLEVNRALTCNSLSALIELTIAGVGISCFPVDYVEPLVRNGYLVLLKCERDLPQIKYHFQWRDGDNRALISALRELVIEEVDFHPPYRF